MKLSLNWLKQYINLDGISTDEVVEKLTTAGLEVDDVIDQKKLYNNFVVGYVKEREDHPNADKLSKCKVEVGGEEFPIVCGAPNVKAGQKIILAKVGAVIPNSDFTISKAKIRGEESMGMICSERELGISDNHEGIMVLDENIESGTEFCELFGFNDVIIDIDITPNRADAFSHVGSARDLAAMFGRNLNLPEIKLSETDEDVKTIASIEIENAIDCPRYVAKVIKNVTIKESPKWLKDRLLAIGLRPINNVVDVTNFILYEIGQPLHAFDLDKLAGNKIIVRSADKDEKFITLDSKERKLLETDLLICDAEKAVAIAGVMGGENSEVTNETKNILIESAYFRPSSVRKTSKKLGLQTDASIRFERGCDVNITLFAAKRAAQLIAELGDGEITKGEIDIYPNEIAKKEVSLRVSRVKKILGFEVAIEKIKEIFIGLEFEIVSELEEVLTYSIPTFRHDIEREIDLIEEIARVYGYDNIPEIARIGVSVERRVDNSRFNDKVRETLSSLGFYEIITNSLLNKELASKYGNPIGVLNPQSFEMSHIRPSLVPGLLATISRNVKVNEKNLKLYEIGHVITKFNDEIKDFSDFEETEHLLFAITGLANDDEWHSKKRESDFYDLKGFANSFFKSVTDYSKVKVKYNQTLEDGIFEYSISNIIGKNIFAEGGKIRAEVLKEFGISQNVFAFDINLTELKKNEVELPIFKELLKFPKIKKDCAFVLDSNIDYNAVVKIIISSSTNLLKNVKLFDIFESESLGVNKKSLAFELSYFDDKRTLTEEEVEKEFWKAIESVKTKLNAELRG
ncbi:MAG: phenylalanine--tRNA ligase subunit beta [Bacteroidetes bacterium]|nr:phenylalanine--tRNA ligase subunit beta [Bacteroidota bacterium]MBU1114996.1 phenylalanine--tRNA ligase subunit beta [Bacteroidota bacterium]MBU1797526.1 phenylalanine--tRNA ligase subunit beta [Bacteroidota bacterium]